jgi:hypothetical protein
VESGESENAAEEEVMVEGDLGDDVLVYLRSGWEGGEGVACCCCVEVEEF